MQLFPKKYKNTLHCAKTIIQKEGVKTLWNGLSPGLLRQAVFGTLRIAFFDQALEYTKEYKGEDNITVFDRTAIGIVTGGLAMVVANPIDVIKVRFQAAAKSSTIGPKKQKSVFHAFPIIYKAEGLNGFYQSQAPNVLRNSVINAAELGSYSQIKYTFSKGALPLFNDGLGLHLFSSTGAGIQAVLFGSPFDVLKSRVMNGKTLKNGTRVPYKSVGEAIIATYKEGGIKNFYKGFSSMFNRKVSWNITMFLIREEILDYFKRNQS